MVQAKLTVAQRGHSCSHTWFACAWHSKVDSSLEHCVYADQSAGAGAAEGLEGKPKMSLAGDADSTTFDAQLEDLDTQIAAVCERIPHLKGQLLQNDANIKSLLQLAVSGAG